MLVMHCGYTGVDPYNTIPNWIRTIRNNDGSTRVITITATELISHTIPGHIWEPDLNSGPRNSTGSRLLIGPVDESYDQSIYQCSFSTLIGTINSNPGMISVHGQFIHTYILCTR